MYNKLAMTRFDPFSVIPLFVVSIVLIGVVYANISRQRFLNQTIAQSSIQPEHKPDPTPTQSAEPTPSPTIVPTSLPSTLKQNSANPSSASQNSDINAFKYPGSTTKSATSSHLELESTDSPNKITDWYKTKIKSLGLNTFSASATNTNDNILNALTAAGQGISLKVEIRKASNNSYTTININF